MRETTKREDEALKRALEKMAHERRWERDGFGQLRYGKEAAQTSELTERKPRKRWTCDAL